MSAAKLFTISPDEDWPHDYHFNATHRWSIPGVKCEACGWIGGSVGVAYPSLTLPSGITEEPYRDPTPLAPPRVKQLIAPLLLFAGNYQQLREGAEFGPLIGSASGSFGDFTWVNPWTPLLTASATERLNHSGIRGLRPVHTSIERRGGKAFEHLELEVYGRIKLAPAGLPPGAQRPCACCGVLRMHRDPRKWTWQDDPIVSVDSIPSDTDIFRIRELEGQVLVTEQFRIASVAFGLSGVKFAAVRLSE